MAHQGWQARLPYIGPRRGMRLGCSLAELGPRNRRLQLPPREVREWRRPPAGRHARLRLRQPVSCRKPGPRLALEAVHQQQRGDEAEGRAQPGV